MIDATIKPHCDQCKGSLGPKRLGARFCSSKCRNDFNNELKRQDVALGISPSRAKIHKVVNCIVCDALFTQSRSSNRYCSSKCRVKHNNANYAAKKAEIDNDINDLL